MNETSLTTVGDLGEHKGGGPPFWPSESGWTVEIIGEVENEKVYTLDELKGQAQEMRLNVDCVSVGYIYKRGKSLAKFTGIFLDQLLRDAIPTLAAKTVVFVSAAPGWTGPASMRHETPLELDLCLAPQQVLLAGALDDEPLEYKNGGPLRSVVDGAGIDEKRYFYKSLKWLSRIEVIADPLTTCGRGTWEQFAGYSLRGKVGEDKVEPFVAKVDEEGVPRRPAASSPDELFKMHCELLTSLLDSGDLSLLVGGKLDRVNKAFTKHQNWNPRIRLRSDETDDRSFRDSSGFDTNSPTEGFSTRSTIGSDRRDGQATKTGVQ